ncbi:hypothetical protein LIA77_04539 [Sarocladium implicatum]|nr:hypothetical protein LIA77_04539 [Sarocladium implicatum]
MIGSLRLLPEPRARWHGRRGTEWIDCFGMLMECVSRRPRHLIVRRGGYLREPADFAGSGKYLLALSAWRQWTLCVYFNTAPLVVASCGFSINGSDMPGLRKSSVVGFILSFLPSSRLDGSSSVLFSQGHGKLAVDIHPLCAIPERVLGGG